LNILNKYKDNLNAYFSKFGEVIDSVIILDKFTGISRLFLLNKENHADLALLQ